MGAARGARHVLVPSSSYALLADYLGTGVQYLYILYNHPSSDSAVLVGTAVCPLSLETLS